jgi:uncharacterized damage-inducible protein DinB
MEHTAQNDYLNSAIRLFKYYKSMGDKAIERLDFEQLQWQGGSETNSISIIVKHLRGNMLSRWTDFLNSDGEKVWRNRDQEFEDDFEDKEQLTKRWEEGWNCLFSALNPLKTEDLSRIVYIRNEEHTVMEAINRQIAHYAYHVGQMVFLAKMLAGEKWESLSIPKGQSAVYNKAKFGDDKSK